LTNWQPRKIGEVIRLEYGKPLPIEDRRTEGAYPAFGANGELCRTDRYYFEGPSFIVGRKGSAGEINLTPARFWPLDVTYFVTFDTTKYDRMFLFYALKFLNLPSLAKGVKPGINRNDVYDLSFPFPPLKEQRRIVAILDDAFAGLDTVRANAEQNLQNSRDLYYGHLNDVFTRDTGGWETRQIGQISNVYDGPHATPKTIGEGPIFLGISALKDGVVDLQETRHVSDHDYRKWTRRVRPQEGDIVFSYETRLGQAAIIPKELKCCLGRRMGLVRVDRNRLDPQFFLHQYLSPPFRKFLDSRTIRGATVDRISIKEFPRFLIAVLNFTSNVASSRI
jgi:type I restriction enzyme S subunit